MFGIICCIDYIRYTEYCFFLFPSNWRHSGWTWIWAWKSVAAVSAFKNKITSFVVKWCMPWSVGHQLKAGGSDVITRTIDVGTSPLSNIWPSKVVIGFLQIIHPEGAIFSWKRWCNISNGLTTIIHAIQDAKANIEAGVLSPASPHNTNVLSEIQQHYVVNNVWFLVKSFQLGLIDIQLFRVCEIATDSLLHTACWGFNFLKRPKYLLLSPLFLFSLLFMISHVIVCRFVSCIRVISYYTFGYSFYTYFYTL